MDARLPATPPHTAPPHTAAPHATPLAAWTPGPPDASLADGELHVWRAELTSVDPALGELLALEEHERAARILGARQRELWRRSRGVLRALLGGYLGVEPRALRIALGANGKPRLAGDALCFNLSHSGELALYVFARGGAVGVDVELKQPRGAGRERDVVALARRMLGEHAADSLDSLAPARRELEFLRLWTRYEAELKWRGAGIGGRAPRADGEPAPWLAELDVGPRGAAAVACSSPPRELRRWDWPPLRRS